MRNFMTLLLPLLVLLYMQLGCSDNCNPEKANIFQEVSQSEISNLKKINELILKNIDILIKADENNEADSIRGRRDKFHSISSGRLEQYFPHKDSLEFEKLSLPFNDTKNKFYFHKVYYRASDSTFDYQLRLEICDNPRQAIDIIHYLLFRTSPKDYNAYKNEGFAKEMKLDSFCTYYITNTPNDPR
jgi:hypothetical protein